MEKIIFKWFKILVDKTKMVVAKWTTFLIKKLSKFELVLNRHTENPNPNGYEDLTPTKEGDTDGKYSAALEWALKNDNIKNIALTGAYGSGKSSILRSFEDGHREYEYLNISLASFSDNNIKIVPIETEYEHDEQINENEQEKKKKESNIDRLIELSILQQMFYHVKHKTIPDSRFKRIKSISKKELLFKTIGLIIWILALILFFKPKFVLSTALWGILDLSSQITAYILFIIIIIGIGIMIAKFIRVANNSKLNKLNVQSGEIEINKEIDSSILNKHLDEILYFFEATNYDVVIIEDLDRFDNPEIFTKLRELNILINSSTQINRRIVFIYAIKDDMFHDKNRTKFFDFIIPIIPVINTSNSGDMLHRMLGMNKSTEESESVDFLSTNFIDDVSMYIDDMRLLKNICNEYAVYKGKLDRKLNHDYLLAMIIYKNIFPSDFVDLHNDNGKVYSIFDNKQALIKEKTDEIDSEIRKNKQKIEKIENVCVKNIQELRAIYIEALRLNMPNAIAVRIKDNQCQFSKLKEDEFFSSLSQSPQKIAFFYTRFFNVNNVKTELQEIQFSFSDLENIVDSEMTYNERERLIYDKENGEIEKLKKRIEELKREKTDIKTWTLQQIAEKIDIGSSFEKIKNDKLIVYLIRNGYINENYHYYISYFHEGLITKDDREFLFSIKNQEPLSFEYKLTKVENLIKKIRPKEFESKAALNCSLVDFILQKQADYDEQWRTILKQLCNKSNSAIKFIDRFIDKGINIDLFITALCKKWHTIWDFIISETDYSEDRKDVYLKLIIEHLDIDTITLLNSNHQISNYLSQKKNFISTFSNDSKVQEVLNTLNIKFEKLDQPESSSKLFDFIYENDLYKINKEMISLFIKTKSSSESTDNLNSANYTTIKRSGCGPLIKYIDDNLNEYISSVFLILPENIQESEEFILDLLCTDEEFLSLEKRKKIIEKQSMQITNLSSIDVIEHSLLEFIVQKSKMFATWENVICYFELKEELIDDLLISYLNQETNYIELAETDLNKENKSASKITKAIIINENISDDSFEYLLPCLPYAYSKLDFENLSGKKVDLMIKNGYLLLSVERFDFLKKNFPERHINLLKRYAQTFIVTQVEYSLDKNDVQALLTSSEFNPLQKLSIIQNTDSKLIIEDRELSNSICNILALDHYIELDFDLLKSLIQYGRQIDNKLKLFILQFNTLTKAQITELLGVLGEPYSIIAIKGRNPSLPKNPLSLQFIKKLKEKECISSFKEKENNIKVYTKQI